MKKLEIKPEDKAKVAEYQKRKQAQVKVDEEHLLIAEFGFIYGWQAIEAVLNDQVTSQDFIWLLESGRRVSKKQNYERTKAAFIGAAASKSRNPTQTFTKITSEMLRNSKADK